MMTNDWKLLLLVSLIIVLLFVSFSRNTVYHSGLTLWNDVSKKSPRNRRALSNLCTYYSAERNYDKGISVCSTALSINPEVPDRYLINAYINRGSLYSVEGKHEMAVLDYQNALSLDPTNARIFNNLGNAYAKQGAYADALTSFTRAIALTPSYALAYANRGAVYLEIKNYSNAMVDLSQAIHLNPLSAQAYMLRGLIYREAGRNNEAILDFTTACRIGNAEACDHLRSISTRT